MHIYVYAFVSMNWCLLYEGQPSLHINTFDCCSIHSHLLFRQHINVIAYMCVRMDRFYLIYKFIKWFALSWYGVDADVDAVFDVVGAVIIVIIHFYISLCFFLSFLYLYSFAFLYVIFYNPIVFNLIPHYQTKFILPA